MTAPRRFPIGANYVAGLQNPHICFPEDKGLQSAQFTPDNIGLPYLRSGSFACVGDAMEATGQRYAIRLFVRQPPDADKMRAIADFIASETVQQAAASYFACYEYLEDGAFIDGDRFPYVKMEWVVGQSLRGYIEAALQRGAPDTLADLAQEWVKLISLLYYKFGIAHGDLQSGNIMVRPDGTLCLIDYDGMYLPAFKGAQSPVLGQADYQHPGRSTEEFDENLDIFSALVIYSVLLLLSEAPRFWDKYTAGDGILFSKDDFRNPRRSALMTELRAYSSDPRISQIADVLCLWCEQSSCYPVPQEAVELFENLFPRKRASQLTFPAVVIPQELPPLPARWKSSAIVTPAPKSHFTRVTRSGSAT